MSTHLLGKFGDYFYGYSSEYGDPSICRYDVPHQPSPNMVIHIYEIESSVIDIYYTGAIKDFELYKTYYLQALQQYYAYKAFI